MSPQKSITIGIPAHNEEANIAKLLESILGQIGDNYFIEKIIVVCDGCTDRTAEVVYNYSHTHKNIELINDGMRLGKPERTSRFFGMNTSDVFIIFDADCTLASKYTISKLVEKFKDPTVGLVGGNDTPANKNSLLTKILFASHTLWYEIRKDYNNGSNVYNHCGRVSAVSKGLARIANIKNTAADDTYFYFYALVHGFKFKFVPDAVVYYLLPKTWKDAFKQQVRFLTTGTTAANYFGEWAHRELRIPKYLKIIGIIRAFYKEPLYLPLAICFQLAIRFLKPLFVEKYENGVWTTLKSTKA